MLPSIIVENQNFFISMKINLLLTLCTALLLAVFMPSLTAASNAAYASSPVVHAVQATHTASATKHFKKEKRTSRLKAWWGKQTHKLRQAAKWMQRLSLGFVGFIVMLIGGLFIVLGLVIPVIGALFLVLGIIIAFVGLLLWVLLSKVGVRVSDGGGGNRRRQH
jgi:uncharacterized ion transporter superfamily protein YfcC